MDRRIWQDFRRAALAGDHDAAARSRRGRRDDRARSDGLAARAEPARARPRSARVSSVRFSGARRGGRAARAEPARGRRERERHPVTPVAGIVSQSFLTPLSHVNLRAAGWDIPNVALKDAATKFATLDGKLVLFEAGATSASLRAATPVEIANAKKAIRARCTPPTRARMAARPRISERS